MYRFLGWVSGKKQKNIGNINTVKILIFNPNDPYISSTVSVGLLHTAAAAAAAAEKLSLIHI